MGTCFNGRLVRCSDGLVPSAASAPAECRLAPGAEAQVHAFLDALRNEACGPLLAASCGLRRWTLPVRVADVPPYSIPRGLETVAAAACARALGSTNATSLAVVPAVVDRALALSVGVRLRPAVAGARAPLVCRRTPRDAATGAPAFPAWLTGTAVDVEDPAAACGPRVPLVCRAVWFAADYPLPVGLTLASAVCAAVVLRILAAWRAKRDRRSYVARAKEAALEVLARSRSERERGWVQRRVAAMIAPDPASAAAVRGAVLDALSEIRAEGMLGKRRVLDRVYVRLLRQPLQDCSAGASAGAGAGAGARRQRRPSSRPPAAREPAGTGAGGGTPSRPPASVRARGSSGATLGGSWR